MVTIRVSKYEYQSKPWCRFGDVWAEATSSSVSQVSCVAPPRSSSSAGAVELEVSSSSSQRGLSSAVRFEYEGRSVVLEALMPSTASTQGGSVVSVIGSHFGSQIGCRLGDRE